MANKGTPFEREIVKLFSEWWTEGERDDVFWRVLGSGGRAKRRGNKGKKTFGAHGDVAAVDPIGQPLINFATIEIKRGYTKHTVANLLDKGKKAAQQLWETWYEQTTLSTEQAGSFSWLIIARRDQRTAIVFFPWTMWLKLREYKGCFDSIPHPFFDMRLTIRIKKPKRIVRDRIVGMKLQTWLANVSPKIVKYIVKSLNHH